MNLSFRCSTITFGISGQVEDEDREPSAIAVLAGFASFDSPTEGDFGSGYSIPNGIGEELPTSVRLIAAAAWPLEIEQIAGILAAVHLGRAEEIAAVARRTASMVVSLNYLAADLKARHGTAQRANNYEVALRVEANVIDTVIRRLELAVLKPEFMPALSVHGFRFFDDDHAVAKTGVPCWARVVEGVYGAPAPWYHLSFSTRTVASGREE